MVAIEVSFTMLAVELVELVELVDDDVEDVELVEDVDVEDDDDELLLSEDTVLASQTSSNDAGDC